MKTSHYSPFLSRFPLLSFCRRGSWESSGLPNAILRSLKKKTGLNIEHFDSKNIKTEKDPFYKNFLFKIMSPEIEGLLLKNNYLPQIPKLVFLENEDHLKELKKSDYWNDIAAFITTWKNEKSIEEKPSFFYANTEQLVEFIFKTFFIKTSSNPLYGLVLLGGKSKRMKKDKSALDYHGQPQALHNYDLLSSLCDDVYVSCRPEQQNLDHLRPIKNKLLPDRFLEMGPMGGLLTAFKSYPKASWLVLACDLPYVSKDLLKKIIENRNYFKMATCLENPEKGWPEPLCTLYEPQAYKIFMQFLSLGIECPRKILMNSIIEKLKIKNKLALQNVNTPEEFKKAHAQMTL
jgi:molybdopterin-guanine dinucleotide biosynthesis protein A